MAYESYEALRSLKIGYINYFDQKAVNRWTKIFEPSERSVSLKNNNGDHE